MAAVLQSQMAEIKRREEEAALMEQERAGLLREQAELEKVVSSATTVSREPSLLAVLISLPYYNAIATPHCRRRRGNKMKRQGRKWSWGELMLTVMCDALVLMKQ